MKRFITLASLGLSLAIGTTSCAHQQLTKRHAVQVAGTVAVIAGIVLLASQAQCANCNIGIEDPHGALPPR